MKDHMSYVDVTMSIHHAYYKCIKIEIQNSETKIAINGSSDIFCLPPSGGPGPPPESTHSPLRLLSCVKSCWDMLVFHISSMSPL